MTIKDLPSNSFYRRSDGHTYFKLNDEWQVAAIRGDGGNIIGQGVAEAIAPDELVSLA